MTEDDKKKITSLPPPPTDDIDSDWSRPSGSSPEPKASKEAPAKPEASSSSKKASGADLTPPWKQSAKPAAEADEDDEEDEDEDDEEDEDEDDEEDEDEDDEEEEVAPRKGRAPAQKASRDHGSLKPTEKKATTAASDAWIPDAAPWVVLGFLLLLGFVGGFGLLPFSANLKPSAAAEPSATPAASVTSTARPDASALREQMRERRRKQQAADGGSADSTAIRASHLLVAYQGATRSTQTRTKAEAKTRAEQALKRAKKGDDFAKLVSEYSDEPGAGDRGGDLGKFGRGRMVPDFETAAFALKVGEFSGIVETQFGFHVIKRTE